MKRAEISVLLAGVLLALIQFAGCAQKPPTFNKVEILTPKGSPTIAQGQSVLIQANVLNDLNAGGVSFMFASLPGFGTLNPNPGTTSATYTAPNAVSTATVVKIIVTSIDFPNQSATVTITVEPPPTITTTTLANPTLNTAYSASVTATGGLLPLS